MPSKVFANGKATVNVPSGSLIQVQTLGTCNVFQRQVTPNQPVSDVLLGTLINRSQRFGTFTGAVDVLIDNQGPEPVAYEVGTAPVLDQYLPRRQVGPLSTETVAVTLTATKLYTKIITGTHAVGATQAYTLPTGANMDALFTNLTEPRAFEIGDCFEWSLLNLSAAAADSLTLTPNTNHTIVGTGVVASAHATTGGLTGGNTSRWLTRKTAAATYETIRIG